MCFVLVQVYRYRLAAVGATFVCQIHTQVTGNRVENRGACQAGLFAADELYKVRRQSLVAAAMAAVSANHIALHIQIHFLNLALAVVGVRGGVDFGYIELGLLKVAVDLALGADDVNTALANCTITLWWSTTSLLHL